MSWESRLKPTNTDRILDLDELLRSLRPRLREGVYVFLTVSPDANIEPLKPIATFREDEGLSVIVEESRAEGADLTALFRAAWITLTVNSDLNAVGLTATVAGLLATRGISCNVVAAANHDHLFVPIESAEAAMAALAELQSGRDLIVFPKKAPAQDLMMDSPSVVDEVQLEEPGMKSSHED